MATKIPWEFLEILAREGIITAADLDRSINNHDPYTGGWRYEWDSYISHACPANNFRATDDSVGISFTFDENLRGGSGSSGLGFFGVLNIFLALQTLLNLSGLLEGGKEMPSSMP